MTIDFSNLKDLFIDGKKVAELYFNGKKVKMAEQQPKDYLKLTSLAIGGSMALMKTGTPDEFSLEYSTDDGNSWNDYAAQQVIPLNEDKSVMFRRKGNATQVFSKDYNNYWHFVLNGTWKASGNAMSLLDASMESTTVGVYAFARLFIDQSTLVDASELELPATTLDGDCYKGMFYNCTRLSAGPSVLPATTAEVQCYQDMFYDCKSLTSSPAICATSASSETFRSMFYNCTSLSTGPSVLPATTIGNHCYQEMFQNCTSLTSAPEICATSLSGEQCFYKMFRSCTSLSTGPSVLPATNLVNGCYQEMFYDCTSLKSMPKLSATALAQNACFADMFSRCSNLTSATLIFTSISRPGLFQTGCCQNMFAGCTSLSSIETKQTSFTACTKWVNGVASTGTFTCTSALGTDATITRGPDNCPTNWRVANYDVNGYDMQNAFIRGSYTSAFFEDGSSHVPDMNALSVFNGQTAERLYDTTQYTIQLPADTTTAGTKTIQINGIGDYFGTKEISYKIVAKNLDNCTNSIGPVYDNEGPLYTTVVQPDTGYTLIEGTDYTVAVSTSGSQSTVTITGIGNWTGTYTTTVAHKTSGASPITVHKNDSSDIKPLKVTLRNQNFSENISLQCKVDSNAWTAMNIDAQLTANSQVQIRAVDANRRLATGDNNYLWIDTGYNDSTAAAAAVSGNIISLVDRSETQDRISADYTFANTFANNDNLIDASHLSCSQVSSNMSRAFRAVCASRGMGFGILDGNPSQLTGAPDLFANVSAYGNRQYQMGDTCRNCSRLTSAVMTIPALAQSTSNSYSIGNACFQACTSLISAVVKSHNGDGYVPSYFKCLEGTFLNCSNLTCISTDLTAWPTGGFNNWLQNVAATGTFICPEALGTDATIQRGTSYCPTGWTVVNYDA